MCANRGIDTTAGAFGLQDDLVQGFAHAVQPLEFVIRNGAILQVCNV